MEKNILYYYKTEGDFDKKSALKQISSLMGVKNCYFEEDLLFYELPEFVNEYDILTASMEIIENLGGELIVGEFNQEETIQEETVQEEMVENFDGENLEQPKFEEEKVESYQSQFESKKNRVAEEKAENETLFIKRKKLKGDAIMRLCELGASLLFLLLGLFIPQSDSTSAFTFNSVLLILAFAVSVYEVFYYAFIDIIQKKFYSIDLVISLASICLVLHGGLVVAVIATFIYSLSRSIAKLSERLAEIMLGDVFDVELNDEFLAFSTASEELANTKKNFGKNKLVEIILSLTALAVCLVGFLALIPALKLGAYYLLIIGVCFGLVVLSQLFSRSIESDLLANLRVACKYFEIEFSKKEQVVSTAKANFVSADVSAMVDGENLKDDAIGCFKELKILGIKGFKTNFDVEVSQEVKKQDDFVEKPVKNKKVLSVGLENKNVNFARGEVLISSGQMFRVPLWYKLCKKCVRSIGWLKAFSVLAVLAVVSLVALTLLKLTTFISLPIYFAMAIFVISNLLATLSLKNK